MKKIIIPLTITLLAIFASCDKQSQVVEEIGTSDTGNNNSNVRAKGIGEIKVSFPAGHPASQCQGQGACFNYTPGYWPNYVHIPCQGSGKDCNWELTIGTGFSESNAVFGISGYDRDTFLMPSRSLLIPGSSVYLNVPQQAVLQVEGGYQFNGLSLTDRPLFENL